MTLKPFDIKKIAITKLTDIIKLKFQFSKSSKPSIKLSINISGTNPDIIGTISCLKSKNGTYALDITKAKPKGTMAKKK